MTFILRPQIPSSNRSLPKSAGFCLLALYFALFIGVGIRGAMRSLDVSKRPKELVNPQFASTDFWFLRLLGIPHGSERILASLEKIPPQSPILFISRENSDATMTHFLLSSLAWPRPFDQAQPERLGQLGSSSRPEPAAILVYGISKEGPGLGGEQIGNVTLLRVQAP